MKAPIRLRRVRPSDDGFLYRVYVSTRPDITLLNTTSEEKTKLLKHQFKAQTYHYHTHFGDADFLVVLGGNEPIGRLTFRRLADQIHVIDLAILPQHREQGIGTQLMSDIIQEGRISDKPVRLYVEKNNRVFGFYEHLGFVKIGETDSHWLMQCVPARKLVIARN